ncbi:MAG: FHA domain-containing protein [Actinobacteria bacterium]|nr:FHA domain-containing protein [Actinomycetota bacterium]
MRVRVITSTAAADVEVDTGSLERLTIGGLVAAAVGDASSGEPAMPVNIDGRRVDRSAPASHAGLVEGSLIDTAPPMPAMHAPIELDVVGGMEAGETFRLGAGSHRIGRSPFNEICIANPSVSRVHAQLDVTIDGQVSLADLDSRNGCRRGRDSFLFDAQPIDPEPIALGAAWLRVRVPPTDSPDQPACFRSIAARRSRPMPLAPPASTTIPHNRPPRPAPAAPPAPLVPPAAPAPGATTAALSWTMILVPLVLGGVLAMVFGPALALFALLSPVMLVAQWWESRRKNRVLGIKTRRRYHETLDEFARALANAARAERARRWDTIPDPAMVVRRSREMSPSLWERRPTHPDFANLRLGVGSTRWPSIVAETHPEPRDEVRALIAKASALDDVPLTVDLRDGWLGIVGPREPALAVARWLACQMAALHGPADVPMAIVGDAESVENWTWFDWLPHSSHPTAGALLAHDEASTERVAAALDRIVTDPDDGAPAGGEAARFTFLVLDRSEPLAAAGPQLRRLSLRPGVRAIVTATSQRDLPARCRWVIEVADGVGRAVLRDLETPAGPIPFVTDGFGDRIAADCARSMACLADPLDRDAATTTPSHVSLLRTLGTGPATPASIDDRWSSSSEQPGLGAVVGATAGGHFSLDLCMDGPHALIAGTTGSGKSELLRTWVASLAATHAPDAVTFVLVDYKGGAAFDACARLPHTVGMVTDLDERLGERALISLEAELTLRERLLRDAGSSDLPAYHASAVAGSAPPLPRLVVIVDEFATLAAELPDFLDALVSIAQRGRSLGVHLVLATQRPSGVINDNIRTNTNLRIALRVLDRADSNDVVGTPDAAGLPRACPGRAIARLGESELATFQTALVSGRSVDPAEAGSGVHHRQPWWLEGPRDPAPSDGDPVRAPRDEPSDLDYLVDAIAEAHERRNAPLPRRPWIEPLPANLPLARVLAPSEDDPIQARDGAALGAPIALVDEPQRQRQTIWSWVPAMSNLLVYGGPGAGKTSTLATVALALSTRFDADRYQMYVIDLGHGDLASLDALPHTGAYIRAHEAERQHRLLRFVVDTIDERRAQGAPDRPSIVVFIDGITALRLALEQQQSRQSLDDLERAFRDGTGVGVHFALSGDSPASIPARLAELAPQRVLLRLADRYDYGMLGVSGVGAGDLPELPGRGFFAPDLEMQVARVDGGLSDAVAEVARATAPPEDPPARIGVLPVRVRWADVAVPPPAAEMAGSARALSLPIAVGDRDLTPAFLRLHDREHVVVAGPARSGRTSTLAAIAEAGRAAGCAVLGHGADNIDDAVTRPDRRVLVLVDDADRVELPPLSSSVAGAPPRVHVIAAVHAGRLRTAYGHWVHELRSSRTGLALQPDGDVDGDLWSVRLPRLVVPSSTPGRGVLINSGRCEIVQVAMAQ